MEEFPDELTARYTRKELEAMAIDLEVNTVGLSTKAQLAEAIIEAKTVAEEAAAEFAPTETAAEVVPTETAAEFAPTEAAAEFAPTEAAVEKLPKVTLKINGKGVMAKKAAIDEETRSMCNKALAIQKAGQNMRQEGAKHMRERVFEMQKEIDAQLKENQRSIKNFDKGVREIRTEIDKESRSMRNKALAIQKAGQNIRKGGAKHMGERVSEMRNEIDAQLKENQRSIKNFDKGVREIRTEIDKESRATRNKALAIQKAGQNMRLDGIKRMRKNVGNFRAEIDEFVKVDLGNYMKNFYYG